MALGTAATSAIDAQARDLLEELLFACFAHVKRFNRTHSFCVVAVSAAAAVAAGRLLVATARRAGLFASA